MSVTEIESEDVLRLIMQYLKEHNLHASLRQLQSESKVCLDVVDNLENLSNDINHGRWEAVLPQVLPRSWARLLACDQIAQRARAQHSPLLFASLLRVLHATRCRCLVCRCRSRL